MAINTKYIQPRDINGYVGNYFNALPWSINNQYVELTASSVKEVTVPATLRGDNFIAHITYSDNAADVWVQPSNTPTLTLPTGTVAPTTAQLRPAVRPVVPGQVLQFLYSAASTEEGLVSVGISYYAAPSNNVAGQ